MTVVALIALIVGLVLGVFAMLYGTERRPRRVPAATPHERTSEHDPESEPSPLLNLASIAAFSVTFGLTGYLLARNTNWPIAMQLVMAALVGALALSLQSLLIAHWAIPGARAEQVDERFVLQGTLARITRAVPAGGEGMLRYVLDDREVELPARDLDGVEVARGSDVVIERVENGVAFFELWARVESRL